MKYCTKCGAEVLPEAVICPHCGCKVAPEKTQNKSGKVLGTIAFVLMIISIASCAFASFSGIIGATVGELIEVALQNGNVNLTPEEIGLISDILSFFSWTYVILCLLPLAWMIPMTVSVKRRISQDQQISTGFKVCTLIFVNIAAGILLLCRKEPEINQES